MKKILLPVFFIITQIAVAQKQNQVDFIKANASIDFDISQRKILGNVSYNFDVKSEIDTIRIDAKNMQIQSVLIDGKPAGFKYDNKQIKLYSGYKIGDNNLSIKYNTIPKQTVYFIGTGNQMQIWTQGQGKYTSHWLPSFDDYNEKVIYNMSITFDKNYQVVSNGVLANKKVNGNNITWNYQMEQPMSSYLLMFAIGKYDVTIHKSASGIPIESYLKPSDKAKNETTYQHTKQMFDFLEKEIGYNYPWKIYRNIPVEDFLYSGMENTTSTIFNQDFVVDKIGAVDRSYVNVNAHELAHQWFGDLITAKTPKDHWLQEGFATFYALLAERDIYGDDYFYWELYEMAEKIQKESKTAKNTVVYSEGATSLTYYEKGAWALFVLRNQIGDANFQTAVKNYLDKYGFKNVSTDEFLKEVESVYSFNSDKFKKEWLTNQSFDIKQAVFLLKNNPMIQQYLELVDKQALPFSTKKEYLFNVLTTSPYEKVKQEVIYQIHNVPYEEAKEFYDYVANSDNVKVRQAMVQVLKEIPNEYVETYKTFLDDGSYLTQEMALKNIWYQRPDLKHQVLDKSKNWEGFNDKNLRITWLMLALATDNYYPEKKANWYKELEGYAYSKYNSNVRMNAISAMWFLNQYDSNTLPHLVNALVSHKPQFRKFGRDAIIELCTKKEFKKHFNDLIPYLPEDEHIALKKLMDEISNPE
ncbi:M1 family peptidase [Paenimyroides tangerinum]|uniref:Aminopeptidase N n=1 Tax=Paenimyroides tangerinum TaxID=2488728 RepID=A0A3P3WE51_9FLAO|nr:M1 family metallopeptidase [Paenimyroides tangerinum]RRJ92647.1 M1 family peptidase [Paenimyroides tangerinum]